MNISEVRELQIDFVKGYDSTIWKAAATPESSTKLEYLGTDLSYKWNYLWQEVSISCPKADHILEQNKTLELGEETSWTPEKLSAVDTLPSLYLPACEMIKQMDGVGFYNNNEIPILATPAHSLAEFQAPPEYYFW